MHSCIACDAPPQLTSGSFLNLLHEADVDIRGICRIQVLGLDSSIPEEGVVWFLTHLPQPSTVLVFVTTNPPNIKPPRPPPPPPPNIKCSLLYVIICWEYLVLLGVGWFNMKRGDYYRLTGPFSTCPLESLVFGRLASPNSKHYISPKPLSTR